MTLRNYNHLKIYKEKFSHLVDYFEVIISTIKRLATNREKCYHSENKPLAIVAKLSILDVCGCPCYACGLVSQIYAQFSVHHPA